MHIQEEQIVEGGHHVRRTGEYHFHHGLCPYVNSNHNKQSNNKSDFLRLIPLGLMALIGGAAMVNKYHK